MGKYTVLDDSALDAKIDYEIGLCRDRILSLFGKGVYSIALIGGYGRGEGGIREFNGALLPANNYDLLIVLKKICSFERKGINKTLRVLKTELDKRISTVFEASCRSAAELKRVPRIMLYQDVYNSSKTVYGEEIRGLLPADIAAPLPQIEALRVIRNRSVLLLLGPDGILPEGYDATPQQMRTWYSKAVIGFGDAVLILKKSYRTGYSDKMDAIQRLPLEGIFKVSEDADRFKVLHKAASRYRLKGEASALLDARDKDAGLFEQINLWALREYLEDPGFEWNRIFDTPLHSGGSAGKRIRNALANLNDGGLARFLGRAFSGPENIFIHPAEKLFKVLPLLIYRPAEDAVSGCASELALPSAAGEPEVRRECFRIFNKYVA